MLFFKFMCCDLHTLSFRSWMLISRNGNVNIKLGNKLCFLKLICLFADVDLKATAKLFAGRFACGSSVTATDEIVVQGDVKDEILEIIGTKWPYIDSHLIEDLGDQKR